MLARVLVWMLSAGLLARTRATLGRPPRRARVGLPLAALSMMLAACAPVLSAPPVATAQADVALPPEPAGGAGDPVAAPATPRVPGAQAKEQVGYASWYGPKFKGRLTSDGEVFDPGKLTAAHRTLPFGTLVKVTNLGNGRSVVVRINDRGPFKPNRIIDLSRAAAEAIGMKAVGVAKVRLEPIALPNGVVRVGSDGRLHGFQVESRFHRVGQLLVLSRRDGGDPVVVRVVGNDVPPASGVDVLVADALFKRIGPEADVRDR